MALFYPGLIAATDTNDNPIVGATWTFYLEGTLTTVAVYSDVDLITSVGSTVTAGAGGRFANIYYNETVGTRAILRDAGGTTLRDIDPLDSLIIGSSAYVPGGADVALADGGTGASLSDPGADRIYFWDDSAGQTDWLIAGSGLTITNKTLTADAGTGYTDEMARDAIGAALTDTGLAVVTPNDGADTIDINVPAAVASDYRTGTDATKALTPDGVWDAADYVALTDAATVAVDMSAGFNFSLTIGGNRTLGAPTNTKNGQTGAIVITQDGTGNRTLAYHANWKFAGGTDPTLSTAAGTVDVLFYQVISSTVIVGNLVKAIA